MESCRRHSAGVDNCVLAGIIVFGDSKPQVVTADPPPTRQVQNVESGHTALEHEIQSLRDRVSELQGQAWSPDHAVHGGIQLSMNHLMLVIGLKPGQGLITGDVVGRPPAPDSQISTHVEWGLLERV